MKKKDVIARIEDLLMVVDKCRNAYYWKPASSSSSRRWSEKNNSIPEFSWTEGGDKYTAEFVYKESCNHVYAYGVYTRNGKKTTLTAIKNSLERLRGKRK